MAKKLALLIGVSEYGEGFEPLSAPPKDVAALQQVLQNPELGGFDQVKTLLNPSMVEMQKGILELFNSSTKEDLVVLFFSGHGVTNDNHHLYFCTRQTAVTDYLATAVPARFIQNLSDNSNYAKHQVIILDCCYSGAFAEGWQRKGDVKLELERELGKEGRVVLTSSLSTQMSFQWADGNLSLYTQYLVEGIETGAADTDQDGVVKVRELHDYAKHKVRKVKPKMQPHIIVADGEGYDIVLSRVRASQFHLQTFSFEVVGVDAKGKVVRRESKQARYFAEDLGNGIALEMVQIPGGTFTIGSTEYEDEKPPHLVTVKPFFMGKFPVTQAQYEAIMNTNPATRDDHDRFVAPDKPVINVNWYDAVAFCDRLSQQTGRTYRLPSEAEWEYACRAGTETPFYFGETITPDLVNYNGNYIYGSAPKGEYREQTTSVGSFPANAFGLFDMHGNLWEWCLDYWHENYQGAPTDGSAWNVGGNSDRRILRGGSLWDDSSVCRSVGRSYSLPDELGCVASFRVVCSAPS